MKANKGRTKSDGHLLTSLVCYREMWTNRLQCIWMALLQWIKNWNPSILWNYKELWNIFQINVFSLKSRFSIDEEEKCRLLQWVATKVLLRGPKDLSTCWKDGILLCALIEGVVKGSCPRYDLLNPDQGLRNLKLALQLIETHINIKPGLTAEDIVRGDSKSERKLLVLLAQLKLASAKLRLKSAFCQSAVKINAVTTIGEEQRCMAKGMGLLLAVKGRKARFNIFLKSISTLDIVLEIRGPGNTLCSERITSRSPKKGCPFKYNTFTSSPKDKNEENSQIKIPFEYEILPGKVSVGYTPLMNGKHKLSIIWQGQHIMGSPYTINVDNSIDLGTGNNSPHTRRSLMPLKRTPSMSIDDLPSVEEENVSNRFFSTKINLKNGRSSQKLGNVTRRRVLRHVITVDGEEVVIEDPKELCNVVRSLSMQHQDKDVEEMAREQWKYKEKKTGFKASTSSRQCSYKTGKNDDCSSDKEYADKHDGSKSCPFASITCTQSKNSVIGKATEENTSSVKASDCISNAIVEEKADDHNNKECAHDQTNSLDPCDCEGNHCPKSVSSQSISNSANRQFKDSSLPEDRAEETICQNKIKTDLICENIDEQSAEKLEYNGEIPISCSKENEEKDVETMCGRNIIKNTVENTECSMISNSSKLQENEDSLIATPKEPRGNCSRECKSIKNSSAVNIIESHLCKVEPDQRYRNSFDDIFIEEQVTDLENDGKTQLNGPSSEDNQQENEDFLNCQKDSDLVLGDDQISKDVDKVKNDQLQEYLNSPTIGFSEELQGTYIEENLNSKVEMETETQYIKLEQREKYTGSENGLCFSEEISDPIAPGNIALQYDRFKNGSLSTVEKDASVTKNGIPKCNENCCSDSFNESFQLSTLSNVLCEERVAEAATGNSSEQNMVPNEDFHKESIDTLLLANIGNTIEKENYSPSPLIRSDVAKENSECFGTNMSHSEDLEVGTKDIRLSTSCFSETKEMLCTDKGDEDNEIPSLKWNCESGRSSQTTYFGEVFSISTHETEVNDERHLADFFALSHSTEKIAIFEPEFRFTSRENNSDKRTNEDDQSAKDDQVIWLDAISPIDEVSVHFSRRGKRPSWVDMDVLPLIRESSLENQLDSGGEKRNSENPDDWCTASESSNAGNGDYILDREFSNQETDVSEIERQEIGSSALVSNYNLGDSLEMGLLNKDSLRLEHIDRNIIADNFDAEYIAFKQTLPTNSIKNNGSGSVKESDVAFTDKYLFQSDPYCNSHIGNRVEVENSSYNASLVNIFADNSSENDVHFYSEAEVGNMCHSKLHNTHNRMISDSTKKESSTTYSLDMAHKNDSLHDYYASFSDESSHHWQINSTEISESDDSHSVTSPDQYSNLISKTQFCESEAQKVNQRLSNTEGELKENSDHKRFFETLLDDNKAPISIHRTRNGIYAKEYRKSTCNQEKVQEEGDLDLSGKQRISSSFVKERVQMFESTPVKDVLSGAEQTESEDPVHDEDKFATVRAKKRFWENVFSLNLEAQTEPRQHV